MKFNLVLSGMGLTQSKVAEQIRLRSAFKDDPFTRVFVEGNKELSQKARKRSMECLGNICLSTNDEDEIFNVNEGCKPFSFEGVTSIGFLDGVLQI